VHPKTEAFEATFRLWEGTDSESSVDISNVRTEFNGCSVNLNEYLNRWADEARNQSMQTFPSGRLSEGVYDLSTNAIREFARGEFLLDGREVKKVGLSVTFKVHVFRPLVISHFDVVTRGRISSLAPFAVAGTTLRVSIISDAPRE
jgi:hypothetical protein